MHFLKRLSEIYSEDQNITNIFVYGSLVQPDASCDEFSDLDITIIQKKFISFVVDIKDALILNHKIYGKMCCQELLLPDGHIADITILSEKEWKRKFSAEPEFYASSVCLGIKSLVNKNNFISKIRIPDPDHPLINNISNPDIWHDFLSIYFSLVKMYLRKDIWRIYGYGMRLAELVSYIVCLQAKIKLYQQSVESGEIKNYFFDQCITFANFNRLQVGRNFEKYATARQKQIFYNIHHLINCNVENLIDLYDLFVNELKEANDKFQLNMAIGNTELFRTHIITLLKKKDLAPSSLSQQKNIYKDLCKLVDDLLL